MSIVHGIEIPMTDSETKEAVKNEIKERWEAAEEAISCYISHVDDWVDGKSFSALFLRTMIERLVKIELEPLSNQEWRKEKAKLDNEFMKELGYAKINL